MGIIGALQQHQADGGKSIDSGRSRTPISHVARFHLPLPSLSLLFTVFFSQSFNSSTTFLHLPPSPSLPPSLTFPLKETILERGLPRR
jgi:hypothetical protein